jgi:hypothetical protein
MKKKISLKEISKICNVPVYEVERELSKFHFKVGDEVIFILGDEEYPNRVTDVGPDGVKMEPIVE